MATDQNTYGHETKSVTDPFAGALTAKLGLFRGGIKIVKSIS